MLVLLVTTRLLHVDYIYLHKYLFWQTCSQTVPSTITFKHYCFQNKILSPFLNLPCSLCVLCHVTLVGSECCVTETTMAAKETIPFQNMLAKLEACASKHFSGCSVEFSTAVTKHGTHCHFPYCSLLNFMITITRFRVRTSDSVIITCSRSHRLFASIENPNT